MKTETAREPVAPTIDVVASQAPPRLRLVSRMGRPIDYALEESFHDEWGKAIDPGAVPVVESFEACTAPENRYIMNWLGDVSGLKVLDLGCGAGEAAVYFATHGAQVTAVDISSGMLEVTRRVAERYGVEVSCVQGRAEELQLEDASFDIVYAANMLHHVDMEACLSEVCRVLKPDGRFVSWDPLRHNPIINLYRKMAMSVRTEDESPLSIHDVSVFRSHFLSVEHRCFWLASLWIFMRFFLIDRVHPSKERYWKKIIICADSLSRTFGRLSLVDRTLLRWFPWLNRMCWNLVVCANRPTLRNRSKPPCSRGWMSGQSEAVLPSPERPEYGLELKSDEGRRVSGDDHEKDKQHAVHT